MLYPVELLTLDLNFLALLNYFNLAERVGFEPTDRCKPITSLAGKPIQPDSGTSPSIFFRNESFLNIYKKETLGQFKPLKAWTPPNSLVG
tara:strand:+ start:195 stop:464 length:270 start_codon:yes stop_codon:yes gene_type:complete